METKEPEFEMYRDPFRMLTLLIDLVCDVKGIEFQWDNIPSYENSTFELVGSGEEPHFLYKKDQTRIEWFQTFGRDIHCNKDLSRSEYNRMFVDCMASVYQS
jgi:hypothetical protein